MMECEVDMKEICAISRILREVIYEDEDAILLECGHKDIL